MKTIYVKLFEDFKEEYEATPAKTVLDVKDSLQEQVLDNIELDFTTDVYTEGTTKRNLGFFLFNVLQRPPKAVEVEEKLIKFLGGPDALFIDNSKKIRNFLETEYNAIGSLGSEIGWLDTTKFETDLDGDLRYSIFNIDDVDYILLEIKIPEYDKYSIGRVYQVDVNLFVWNMIIEFENTETKEIKSSEEVDLKFENGKFIDSGGVIWKVHHMR